MNIVKPLTTALVAASTAQANPVRRDGYMPPCSNGLSPDTAIGTNSPVIGNTTLQRLHTYSFVYAARHAQGSPDPLVDALLAKCVSTFTISSFNCGVQNVQTCPDVYSNCAAAGNAQLLATATDRNNSIVAEAFTDNTQGDITEFQQCLTNNFQSLVTSTLESPTPLVPTNNSTVVVGTAKVNGAVSGITPKKAALALGALGAAAFGLL